MNEPASLVYRKFKPFDVWAWFQCFVGFLFMFKFGGVASYLDSYPLIQKWVGTTPNWWMFFAFLFFTLGPIWRVSFGKVTRLVYYNTMKSGNLFVIEITNSSGEKEQYSIFSYTKEALADYVFTTFFVKEFKILQQIEVSNYTKKVDEIP